MLLIPISRYFGFADKNFPTNQNATLKLHSPHRRWHTVEANGKPPTLGKRENSSCIRKLGTLGHKWNQSFGMCFYFNLFHSAFPTKNYRKIILLLAKKKEAQNRGANDAFSPTLCPTKNSCHSKRSRREQAEQKAF